MWIIVAVILAFIMAGALNKASKKVPWTQEDDIACQLDEDLDDKRVSLNTGSDNDLEDDYYEDDGLDEEDNWAQLDSDYDD